METASSLLSSLKWQIDAGADEAVCEAPVNRFAEAPQAAPAPGPTPGSPPGPAVEPPPVTPAPALPAASGGALEQACKLAAAANSLDDIRAALETFDGCPLKQTATNLVYCDGNKEAKIVFVGEAPGAEEDRQGLPFVGPAGKLLDRMMGAIGLGREDVLITNTLFWRPPGNRNPSPAEAAVCLPFVERTLEIVDPEILVLVGGTAAKTLLAQTDGIMKLRGRWFEYESARMVRPIPAMAIYHPAFLLRSPGQKRDAWRDLLEIKKRMDGQAS